MNSLYNYAISTICKTIKDERAILRKTSHRKTMDFAFTSYSISALEDILEHIRQNRDKSPLTIVEEYRDKMDTYACSKTEGSYIFSVAYDVATGVLDDLLIKGVRY